MKDKDSYKIRIGNREHNVTKKITSEQLKEFNRREAKDHEDNRYLDALEFRYGNVYHGPFNRMVTGEETPGDFLDSHGFDRKDYYADTAKKFGVSRMGYQARLMNRSEEYHEKITKRDFEDNKKKRKERIED